MNTANVASENVVRTRDWRTIQTNKCGLNSGNAYYYWSRCFCPSLSHQKTYKSASSFTWI